jgi:hypothetical protein
MQAEAEVLAMEAALEAHIASEDEAMKQAGDNDFDLFAVEDGSRGSSLSFSFRFRRACLVSFSSRLVSSCLVLSCLVLSCLVLS